MQLFDSNTQRIERFRRRPGKPVSVYVCGITPYDTTHLGHAFTYVVFDVLMRHLDVVHGWPIDYVQNLTDIDDDILRRSSETDEDWRELATKWTQRFTTDMAALNVRPPRRFPGATAYIGGIQDNVQHLLESGLAYASGGSVYYRVDALPEFGRMARLSRDELLATANERGNMPDDPHKSDPLDFVLWQAGKRGEPAWDSPWGPGRPGWHIECSTMAHELLGDPVDIHGGGADLLFPHHACELAQCEPITGVKPWVRFWMHIAMVHMDGQKMSKSLGNLVLIHDLLQRYPADAVRLYLLRNHYRTEWEWNPDDLDDTVAWMRTLWAANGRSSGNGAELDPAPYGPRFTAAMNDDLDTPTAVDVVMALADDLLAAPAGANVDAARDVMRTISSRVLGMWLQPYDDVPQPERSEVTWPAPETAPPDHARL